MGPYTLQQFTKDEEIECQEWREILETAVIRYHYKINKFQDPVEPAQEDIGIEEALDVVAQDPGLLYLVENEDDSEGFLPVSEAQFDAALAAHPDWDGEIDRDASSTVFDPEGNEVAFTTVFHVYAEPTTLYYLAERFVDPFKQMAALLGQAFPGADLFGEAGNICPRVQAFGLFFLVGNPDGEGWILSVSTPDGEEIEDVYLSGNTLTAVANSAIYKIRSYRNRQA